MARDFWKYWRMMRKKWDAGRMARRTKFDQPYWILLPIWLSSAYSGNKRSGKTLGGFIKDILWAQYCLFLFVRIQDDLFDKHVSSQSLIFISNRFLLEAERKFSIYFAVRSSFWKIYRAHLRETTLAIQHVDKLQRSLNAKPRHLLVAYAKVNAIFKTASIAVCLKYDRMRDFEYIQQFADEVATGSQILDDFEDIVEDLHRKRFNYAANVILRSAPRTKDARGTNPDRIARSLVFTPAGTELLTEVRDRLARGYDALKPLGIAEAGEFSEAYRRSLDAIQTQFNYKRAKLIVGKVALGKRKFAR